MCFGIAWSTTAFVTLVIFCIISYIHKFPAALTGILAFIAFKELLQTILYLNPTPSPTPPQYTCNNINKLATTLSWVHISLQPLFFNWVVSAFSKHPEQYHVPLVLCAVFAIANIFRIKELRGSITTQCNPINILSSNMCRSTTCSHLGNYHIAYGFELEGSDYNVLTTPCFFTYYLLTFVPALAIGDFLLPFIHAMIAILASFIAPHNVGEAGAIWCLNSWWGIFLVIYLLYHKNK